MFIPLKMVLIGIDPYPYNWHTEVIGSNHVFQKIWHTEVVGFKFQPCSNHFFFSENFTAQIPVADGLSSFRCCRLLLFHLLVEQALLLTAVVTPFSSSNGMNPD